MIHWVYVFVDRPLDRFESSAAFWTGATGSGLSARRGANGEFATLLPGRGDPYLKLQGVHDGGGVHLDLSVSDVPAAAVRALDLGATTVAPHDRWVVMRSPAGQLFCFVPWHGEAVPAPAGTGTTGARSRLDLVCIEVGAATLAAERAFWTAVTGWSTGEPELLAEPAGGRYCLVAGEPAPAG